MGVQLVPIESGQKSWFAGPSIERNIEKRWLRQRPRDRSRQRFYENLASVRIVLSKIGGQAITGSIFLKGCIPCIVPYSLCLSVTLISDIIILHVCLLLDQLKDYIFPHLCETYIGRLYKFSRLGLMRDTVYLKKMEEKYA